MPSAIKMQTKSAIASRKIKNVLIFIAPIFFIQENIDLIL